MITIKKEDFINSITSGFQFISYYHPKDFIEGLTKAYYNEKSEPAKNAIAQLLVNSKMAAEGKRPICQDTGMGIVFLKIGMDVKWDTDQSIQDMVNEGIRRAYTASENPLRASVLESPIGQRKNTKDNSPGVIHMELVPGDKVEVYLAAKGFGSENKSKLLMLNPSDNIVEAIVKAVKTMGAGWCPPGILGVGLGGTSEKAMLLAKESLLDPVDIHELIEKGPKTDLEKLRLEIFEAINNTGLGAQGLGGTNTLIDVKIKEYPTHAAGLPVALNPNCVASRHVHFTLDESGEAKFTPPSLSDWPDIELGGGESALSINLEDVNSETIKEWKAGQTIYLSGKILTGRDAAHKRIQDYINEGKELPVDFNGRFIYYVGPVPKIDGEIIGPAGPTTSTRMDKFTDMMLTQTNLLGMIGKAERGDATIESIAKNKSVYLIAVGGAAYLISKSIKSAKVLAFEDLGMEAIHEFEIENMPVIVAVDSEGNSVHKSGPLQWAKS